MTKTTNILLDCDGVIANFTKRALEVLESDLDWTEVHNFAIWDQLEISRTQFWKPINKLGSKFWESLEPLPWAEQFVASLKEIGEITILTSPSNEPDCATGKIKWLHKHFGFTNEEIMVGSRKHLLADNGVLIDDRTENVEKFRAAGGEAFLFPMPWNKKGYDPLGWCRCMMHLQTRLGILGK